MANSPVYIVHLSCYDALKEVQAARDLGLPAFVETCPQYLFLDYSYYEQEGFEGAKYVMTPPLRDKYSFWRPRISGGDLRSPFRQLDDAFDALDRSDKRLEAWVLALALGLPPSRLARLEEVLGSVSRYAGGSVAIYRAEAVVLTAASVQWATHEVADIIFRLWTSGSLEEPPNGRRLHR